MFDIIIFFILRSKGSENKVDNETVIYSENKECINPFRCCPNSRLLQDASLPLFFKSHHLV